ncbi:MAG: acetate--CoA ligase family protein [Spirochaetales bacterium]|nr:acetate--CoA ligase family protein [Spirochaetales bacterium]
MHEIIERAVTERRNLLEPEALALLAAYGLPVPRHELARTSPEAVAAAERIGYPVVLKVVSREVVHKSEIGGVKTGLHGAEDVHRAWGEVSQALAACGAEPSPEGFLLCEQAPPSLECIIGVVKDPQFGHALMFGLGGIFVELIKDVAFRVLPVTREDAAALIAETKSYKLLSGIRGQAPKDIEAVIDCLVKTAALVEDNPAITEIDINPIAVFEKGAMVLDARVLV